MIVKRTLLLLAALLLAACSVAPAAGPTATLALPTSLPPSATTPAASPAPAGLTEAKLRNATYQVPDIGTVELVDGEFDESYGEGATQVNQVGYLQAAFGDLTGDGLPDAAALLWADHGGSGTFIYLAAMINQDGAPQQAGIVLLGDRVKVQSLVIQAGQIAVDYLGFGPNDPMCCPSQAVLRTYQLQGGGLQLLSEVQPTSTVTP
jgi:hypothetical protein